MRMNEKMDENETQSITRWEKSHPAEPKACDKQARWKQRDVSREFEAIARDSGKTRDLGADTSWISCRSNIAAKLP
jgi:hypothetical protein